jgi:hypothetical protein
VDVKVDELRFRHGQPILVGGQDMPGTPEIVPDSVAVGVRSGAEGADRDEGDPWLATLQSVGLDLDAATTSWVIALCPTCQWTMDLNEAVLEPD